eukprot:306193-Alexandrium_andersonii.AAC.1
MSASLVGSEMCIRDSAWSCVTTCPSASCPTERGGGSTCPLSPGPCSRTCLLYTSDAADDM